MTLKEYLEREPSGMAFIEVTEWLRNRNPQSSKRTKHELAARQREAILRYGGDSVGIRITGGVHTDDVSV